MQQATKKHATNVHATKDHGTVQASGLSNYDCRTHFSGWIWSYFSRQLCLLSLIKIPKVWHKHLSLNMT